MLPPISKKVIRPKTRLKKNIWKYINQWTKKGRVLEEDVDNDLGEMEEGNKRVKVGD